MQTDLITKIISLETLGVDSIYSFRSGSNYLYFTGSDYEIYRTNGTASSTLRISNTRPENAGDGPDELTVIGNKLFYTVDDSVNGRELWITTGTMASTRMVHNFAGTTSGSPQYLTAMNDKLYFSAWENSTGRELWSSDGNGVSLVANIGQGDASSTPGELAAFDDKLYYRAWNNGEWNLYITEAASHSTQWVQRFDNDPFRGGPHKFRKAGGFVFFMAYDDDTDTTLWRTDGTTFGTVYITDFLPGDSGSEPINYQTEFNGELLLSRWRYQHGRRV